MGRCVVQTGLGRIAECVLTLSLLGLVSCSEPDPQPSTSPIPAASSPSPSRAAPPTQSADEQNLRAVKEAWEIIRRAWTEDTFSFQGEFWTVPSPGTKWNFGPTITHGASVGKRRRCTFEDL